MNVQRIAVAKFLKSVSTVGLLVLAVMIVMGNAGAQTVTIIRSFGEDAR
jgi:hypothetical protein